MFLLFDAHLIKNMIMLRYTKLVKVLHHPKVLAYIPAFQSTRKIKRHEPTDNVTRERNNLTNNMESELVISRYRNIVNSHNGQHFFAMIPLVYLNLFNGN